MRSSRDLARQQERNASERLYPSARNVIATPVHPPVKGLSDDDNTRPAPERGAGQQHPHP
jgi:hypothetical protein